LKKGWREKKEGERTEGDTGVGCQAGIADSIATASKTVPADVSLRRRRAASSSLAELRS
jgi:hypothetical protein